MRRVIIVNGERHLKSYLRHKPASGTGEGKYICFGEVNPKLISLLEEKKFKRSESFDMSEVHRERFIKEYIEVVGKAGKDLNAKAWWATDIASKNRFKSNLAYLLQQFLEIAEVLKGQDYDSLLIINFSWVMVPSLKEIAKESNMTVICKGIFIKKWKEIFFCRLKQFIGVFYHIVRSYWRRCYSRRELGKTIKANISKTKAYYVIRTFIYPSSFGKDGSYFDAFFGRFPEFLKDKKEILIYACILRDYRKFIERIKKCRGYLIVPLEFFLSLSDILTAAIEILFTKIKVKKGVFFFGYDVTKLINNEFLRTAKGIQFYQFLHYWCARKLFKSVSVETFLMTHENNPWERMCTLAFREKDRNIKVIGYQNTVIPQGAANMFISSYESRDLSLPDVILTLGEETKKMITKYGCYEDKVVKNSCGLKFEYLFKIPPYQRKKRSGNILLALEGVFEAYKVTNYVLRELKDNAFYTVRIRAHPAFPLECFKYKLDCDPEAISNFTVSKGSSLEEDIEWADIVIYWGSTVAMEALIMGRPAIHFNMSSVLSFDPLAECNHLKWSVCEQDALLPKIEEINSLDDRELIHGRNKAKEYLQSYFYPVTEDSLKEFIIN